MEDILDCLIIGGGPAGLTAAVYLGRYRRRSVVIDKGWSRAEWITLSHNLPGYPQGVSGPDLLQHMRKQVDLYEVKRRPGVIETLILDEEGLFVGVAQGDCFRARTAIIATGVVENKPPLPHFADAVRRGLVRTCPICDGYECIDKRIAVLGDGEHAAAEALFLSTYTRRLWLLTATDALPLPRATEDALAGAGIEVVRFASGNVRLEADGVAAFSVEGGQVHRFDAIYTAFGTVPQSDLAAHLKAQCDDQGRLCVDGHQETTIKGLFAAGDLVRGLNQISVAEGEAAIAATAVHNRLPRVRAQ